MTFKATATDLSLCQRCPRLMAYHKNGKKNVWLVGFADTRASYGKLFHDEIAEKFHIDVAGGKLPELVEVFSSGESELKTHLTGLIRTRYFAPFLAKKSAALKSECLIAMGGETEFWVQCLADFLSGIPSLFASPEIFLSDVFRPPGRILSAAYPYSDGNILRVSGKYDCMLFNPDIKEAALFEFKGFKSTDVTIELSQTLIYAWLVSVTADIIPSVNLIYLKNDAPFSFTAADVKDMLCKLPHLFDRVRLVLENRLPLPAASNLELCRNCNYQNKCDADWGEQRVSSNISRQSGVGRDEISNVLSDEGRQRMNQLIEALR